MGTPKIHMDGSLRMGCLDGGSVYAPNGWVEGTPALPLALALALVLMLGLAPAMMDTHLINDALPNTLSRADHLNAQGWVRPAYQPKQTADECPPL